MKRMKMVETKNRKQIQLRNDICNDLSEGYQAQLIDEGAGTANMMRV